MRSRTRLVVWKTLTVLTPPKTEDTVLKPWKLGIYSSNNLNQWLIHNLDGITLCHCYCYCHCYCCCYCYCYCYCCCCQHSAFRFTVTTSYTNKPYFNSTHFQALSQHRNLPSPSPLSTHHSAVTLRRSTSTSRRLWLCTVTTTTTTASKRQREIQH